MIGKTIFYGENVDFEYDELKRILTIVIKNNRNPEILNLLHNKKPFPTNLIEGHDGIYTYFFSTTSVNMNDFHQHDPSGKFTLYTLTKFEFAVSSLFSFKDSLTPSSKSAIVIKDDVIDYFYSPMKKINVELDESKGLFFALRKYKELSDEESQLSFAVNDDVDIIFKVNSSTHSRYHKTYFDGFHSELHFSDKNQMPSYSDIRSNIYSILNFFRFIYRTDFDGFREVEYTGNIVHREICRDIEGTFYFYSTPITENLTNSIQLNRIEPFLGKLFDFFIKTDTVPNYYDKDTFSFSPLKQYVLFSNFDTFSNKLELTDDDLIEQKKISGDVKSYIEGNEAFKCFKKENVERIINTVRDFRMSYRAKMKKIIDSNHFLITRINKKYDSLDNFTKDMTQYRNDLMHGNSINNISFEDLKTIELILYVSILQLIGISEVDRGTVLEAMFFIR
ncbi:MAG: hypothetical protein RBQ91_04220 [Acholeplasma sp.]|nr:hypothetical protein [Acholeplasma sp.]